MQLVQCVPADLACAYVAAPLPPLDDPQPWERAHRRLTKAALAQARVDREVCMAIVDVIDTGAFVHLGYTSFPEYAERMFGWTRHTAVERMRAALVLRDLPAMGAALARGRLTWSHVRELTRIATPGTERAWIDATGDVTAGEAAQMVSGRRRGDLPTDRRRPEDKRYALRYGDLTPETWASLKEARRVLTKRLGHRLTDDEFISELARAALEGPSDPGRSNYQIQLDVCCDCQRVRQTAGNQSVEVSEEMIDTALCDAQFLPPFSCSESGSHVGDSHVGAARDLQLSTIPRLVADLTKATQTIPPATRREVRRYFKNRCAVPGCGNSAFLDVHHLVDRAAGGTHDPTELSILCGSHHRSYHRGTLIIEGTKRDQLTFKHADGTPYGQAKNASPQLSQAFTDAYQALLRLGYRQTEAREAVRAARSHVGANADADRVLRAALKGAAPWTDPSG